MILQRAEVITASANSEALEPAFEGSHYRVILEVLSGGMLLPKLNPRASVAEYGEISYLAIGRFAGWPP
jgi:hypothetical protein